MSSYRTGPWSAHGRAVYADDGHVIAVFSHPDATLYQDFEAASIAAAAHDLLAALEDTMCAVSLAGWDGDACMDKARAAIAKARCKS